MISKILNYLNPKKAKAKLTNALVKDGDTIHLWGGVGNLIRTKVRLVGINAPETKASEFFGHKEQLYGQEAKEFLVKELQNQYVTFVPDSHNTIDIHGRTLGYIHLNGIDVVESLLINGFAKVYNYKGLGFDKLTEYTELEKLAKEHKVGVWSKITKIIVK